MRKMNRRYYDTFEEALNRAFESEYQIIDVFATWVLTGLNSIYTGAFLQATFPNLFKNDSGNNVFKEFIGDIFTQVFNMERDMGFLYLKDDSIDEEYIEARKRLHKFLQVMNATAPRYTSLLALYKAKQNNLLEQIHTQTEGLTKFNDTPQGSGDFSDDTHTSNITDSSGNSYTDGMTLMSRLKEVQDIYSNLIASWQKEFNGFFWEEYDDE